MAFGAAARSNDQQHIQVAWEQAASDVATIVSQG
jgi:hypothetical protein